MLTLTVTTAAAIANGHRRWADWKRKLLSILLPTCTAHVHVHTHKHTLARSLAHAYAHKHRGTHTKKHTVYMHTCTHAHMHTCTHAHMHTCTQAHMHTYHGHTSTREHYTSNMQIRIVTQEKQRCPKLEHTCS